MKAIEPRRPLLTPHQLVEGEGDDYFALGLIALGRNNLAGAENCFETLRL